LVIGVDRPDSSRIGRVYGYERCCNECCPSTYADLTKQETEHRKRRRMPEDCRQMARHDVPAVCEASKPVHDMIEWSPEDPLWSEVFPWKREQGTCVEPVVTSRANSESGQAKQEAQRNRGPRDTIAWRGIHAPEDTISGSESVEINLEKGACAAACRRSFALKPQLFA
jgi:hypothetical protein